MAIWRKTVNIKDLLTDDESPEEVVRIAGELTSRLEKAFPHPDYDLEDIIEEFKDIEVTDKRPVVLFNDTLSRLYDWADAERVWLGL